MVTVAQFFLLLHYPLPLLAQSCPRARGILTYTIFTYVIFTLIYIRGILTYISLIYVTVTLIHLGHTEKFPYNTNMVVWYHTIPPYHTSMVPYHRRRHADSSSRLLRDFVVPFMTIGKALRGCVGSSV